MAGARAYDRACLRFDTVARQARVRSQTLSPLQITQIRWLSLAAQLTASLHFREAVGAGRGNNGAAAQVVLKAEAHPRPRVV